MDLQRLLSAARVATELAPQPADPQLSQEEKVWLLASVQPGTPLYKILRSAIDHAQLLSHHIARADLTTSEGIEWARQRQAVQEATFLVVQQILNHANPQKEQPNG